MVSHAVRRRTPGNPIAFDPRSCPPQYKPSRSVWLRTCLPHFGMSKMGSPTQLPSERSLPTGFEGGAPYTNGSGHLRDDNFVFRMSMISPTKDGDQTYPQAPIMAPTHNRTALPQTRIWFRTGPHTYKPTYISKYGINSDCPCIQLSRWWGEFLDGRRFSQSLSTRQSIIGPSTIL